MTTSTLQEHGRHLGGTEAAPVSLADALAMRLGLALLLWGRRHVGERPARFVPAAPLVGDARWYMR